MENNFFIIKNIYFDISIFEKFENNLLNKALKRGIWDMFDFASPNNFKT